MFPKFRLILFLNPIKQVRMIAYFSELHQDILKEVRRIARLNSRFCQNFSVKLLLQFRQFKLYMNLRLRGQVFCNINFNSSEQKWSNNFVKRLHDFDILGFSLFLSLLFGGKVEQIIKTINFVKYFRENEVKKGPELGQVILKWGACE